MVTKNVIFMQLKAMRKLSTAYSLLYIITAALQGDHGCLGVWSFCYHFSKVKRAYAGFAWVCTIYSFHSEKSVKVGRRNRRTISVILI